MMPWPVDALTRATNVVRHLVSVASLITGVACQQAATEQLTTGGAFFPAWSPDGRHIAYMRPGVRDELSILTLDDKKVAPAIRTQGRIDPMVRWSPDGRALAFGVEPSPGAEHEVQIVSLGHSPRTVVSPGFAPRWSPDATRLGLLRRSRDLGRTELWVLDVESGAQRAIVPAVAEQDHAWTPDGQALIYVQGDTLFATALDGRATRRLTAVSALMGLHRMANLDATRDGRVAFVHEGKIWTLNLADGASTEVCAVRRPRGLAFSPDGASLAFIERFPDGVIWVVPSHGGRPRAVARVTCLACRIRFDWAPDGRRLVVTQTPTTERHDLYLMPASGGEPRLVARRTSWGHGLRTFSPDSRQLVYVDGDLGPANELIVSDLDGGRTRRLTSDGTTSKLYPQWSPDGRWVAYFAGRAPDPQQTLELWVVRAEGGEPRLLTPGMGAISGDGFAWSPASDALVFASGTDNELWTVSVADGVLRRVTNTRGGAGGWKGIPSWSPDGSAFAYYGGTPAALHKVSRDGTERKRLTDRVLYRYAWSPDGSAIVLSTERGVTTVLADGTRERLLTGDGGDDPAWSPDTASVVYIGPDNNLWRLNVKAGLPGPITREGDVVSASFSPDGRWIAYHRVVSEPDLWIVEVAAERPRIR